MKRAAMILVALAAILTAAAAPVRTATENFVTNKIADATTTVATAATNYTDSAVAAATSGCLSLSGGTMHGDIEFDNSQHFGLYWPYPGDPIYNAPSLVCSPMGFRLFYYGEEWIFSGGSGQNEAMRQKDVSEAVAAAADAATNYTDSAVATATNACLSLSGGMMNADSTILWPSLHGDSDILIEGRLTGSRMFAIGTSGGNVGFYCYDRWLQLPYKQGTLAVEADISEAISTNNPEFVSAVLAVPLAGADASDLAEIGEYGSYGTVGAAILALIAGLAALKRGKADKAELPYPIVPVSPANGVATVLPRTVATYTAGDSAAAFTVAVGAGETDKARDCELVIDCTATGAVAPAVTWPASFHPHTDAATDFACEAGKRNVYFISEYAPGEFAVGGWQETAGGNA